jgi:nucleoside-diphosphate-sugar epimerase
MKNKNTYNIIEDDIDRILSKVNLLPLKNKSILVTGASGLLGIYFVSCLRRLQEEYNLNIYLWIKSEIESEFKYFFDFPCTIIKEDITDINIFNSLPNFDIIIHSAGYGQPDKFIENKIKTIQINTLSTIELNKKLNKNGKFLFISSSELYNGLSYKITEDQIGVANTDHPRSCYIESKRCGESICHAFNTNNNVKIARLSLCYGPATKNGDTRVVNSLIERGIKNDSIKLLDMGESIRTLCYISDVVEMMWKILLYGKDTVYNIGGIYSLSILDLAKNIGLYFNKNVDLPEVSNELLGSPKIVNISIDRYLNEFDKKEFVSIDNGLKNTIEWQKMLYKKK